MWTGKEKEKKRKEPLARVAVKLTKMAVFAVLLHH
jgi:hypothetical protein